MLNFINTFRQSHIIIRIITIILLGFIAFGIGIHFIEPEAFPTVFDGIWWVIVTTSTVGYGDYVPSTYLGRIFAIILILLGSSFVTFYMVTLASTIFQMFNALKEGSATYKGEEHIIIIGWNERVKNTIHQLRHTNPTLYIVLIDETIKENPLQLNHSHFVKGNSTKDETLRKANIERAGTVLITADQHRNEHEADMQSILTLLAIKGLNPTIYCLIEVLTQEQLNNAIRAGADEVIESYLLSSHVMVTGLSSPGLTNSIISLLDNKKEGRLQLIPVTKELVNLTFEMSIPILLKYNILLIGIKRGEESFLHPSPPFFINELDQLIVIVH